MYGNKNYKYKKTAGNVPRVNSVMKGPQVDDNIFCGPVTLRELKMSLEIDQKILERRKLDKSKKNVIKATEKSSEKVSSSVVLGNKENVPEVTLNGHPIDRSDKKHSISRLPLTPANLSQLDNDRDNSKNSSNTSNATYTLENSDPEIASPTHALNSTYDKLEETESNNQQENTTEKHNVVATLKPSDFKNFQTYRQNPHDSISSDVSLSVDKTVENSVLEATDVNQTNKTIVQSLNNLQVDDVCDISPELSMSNFKDSPMAKALLDASPTVKRSRTSTNRHSVRRSVSQSNYKRGTTPGKMSATAIMELKAEECLINTSFRDSTGNSKDQSIPDVFRQTINEVWKPVGKNVTAKPQTPMSKIPLKKTPSKYHHIQSPVGKYITHGITVQSMSKTRHADCSKEPALVRSKSETKLNSKIPQYNPNVKKKLVLPKIEKDTSSTSLISRRSAFRN